MSTIGIAILILIGLAGSAIADHEGMVMASQNDVTTVAPGISMIGASFSTPYYVGDYEGVTPAISATYGRWSASAMVGLYRLQENGRSLYGLGDVMVSASASVLSDGPWHAGVALGATIPTGDEATGFGMGHVMAMPSIWGTRAVGPVVVSAALGYGRAFADLALHDHGPWPLVDPMNMQEITWAAAATLPVSRRFSVAARGSGGVPVDVPMGMGVDRVEAGVAVTWVGEMMMLAAEFQVGVIGDPFTTRGIVETQVRF